jgi:hypothetical protein
MGAMVSADALIPPISAFKSSRCRYHRLPPIVEMFVATTPLVAATIIRHLFRQFTERPLIFFGSAGLTPANWRHLTLPILIVWPVCMSRLQ